jgi:hypothetical protein
MGAESLTARRCSNCRAMPARLDAEICEYCGKALPRAPGEPLRSTRIDDVAARFAALDAHPDLPRLLQATPEPPSHVASVIQAILPIALLVFLIGFLAPRLAGEPIGLVVLALVAVALLRGIVGIARRQREAHAPVERRKALVVDERTSIHGDGQRDVETRYHATLEFPNGSRRELSVIEDAAGSITPGDIGVAYLRGDHVVAFTRVRV